MTTNAPRGNVQQNGWRTLRGLHPRPIDLGRIALIRARPAEELSRPESLERLIPELGLNDEGLDEFPATLHPFCGTGLLIWQYPVQFGRYLAHLCGLGVRSYLELGIRHGGSFVATVEILERHARLDYAVGVDIIPCPSMTVYAAHNPRARFVCINTQSAGFGALIAGLGTVDLVFIDSHHEEAQCRHEVAAVAGSANMIALHDIANVNCPGVGRVWRELREAGRHECHEFTDQYDTRGPFMGIGLAVKKERPPARVDAKAKE